MRNVLWSVVVASVLRACPIALAAEPEALSQAAKAVALRQEAIKSLLAFLDDETVFREKRQEAEQAVFLLGELRASEAVPILLEHINFPLDLNPPPGGIGARNFPCLVALAKIGNPASEGIVTVMARGEGSRRVLAWALVKIEGAAAALARIDATLAAEADPDRKHRLQQARTSVEFFLLNPDAADSAD